MASAVEVTARAVRRVDEAAEALRRAARERLAGTLMLPEQRILATRRTRPDDPRDHTSSQGATSGHANRRSWVRAAISSARAWRVCDGAGGTDPRAAASATAPT